MEIKVCNVCRDVKRTVTPLTLTQGGNTVTTDRCDEHGLDYVLRDDLEHVTKATREVAVAAKSTRAQGRPRRPVTTIEQIEALKAGTTKNPPNRRSSSGG